MWGISTENANLGNDIILSFTVTDTKGIKYSFAKQEQRVPFGTQEELAFHVTTNWNLDYIQYLNGQEIQFQYDEDEYIDYSFSAIGAATYADIQQSIQEGPIYVSPTYLQSVSKTTLKRQILEKIIFPKGIIDFDYVTHMLAGQGQQQSRTLYTKINIKDNSGNSIMKYDFEYSGNRDYLDLIKRNDEFYYQFDYNKQQVLPEFIEEIDGQLGLSQKPFFQDRWKFYNGQSNSTAALNIPNSQWISNKETSFAHTRLGALKTIIYPTKGYTSVSYELNQIVSDFTLDSEYYESLNPGKVIEVPFGPDSGSYINNFKENFQEITFESPTLASISHSIQGERSDSNVLVSISRADGLGWYPVSYNGGTIPQHPSTDIQHYYTAADYLRQEITQRDFPFPFPPMYPTLVHEFGPDDGEPGFAVEAFNSGGKVLIMPGTYKFSISSTVVNTSATANIRVQLYGKFNEEAPEFVNKDIGGLRVRKLKDCPDGDSSNCITRSFEYNEENGLSSGYLYTRPQNKTVHSWDYFMENGDYIRREAHTYLSNPFTVSNPATGTPVFYTSIIEKINGLQGLGHVERKYSIPFELTSIEYPKRPRGKDLDKSLQLENWVFKEGDNTPISKSKTTYQPIRDLIDVNTQQDLNSNHPFSLKVFKRKGLVIDFRINDYPEHPGNEDDERAIKDLHDVIAYRELDIWDRPSMVENLQDGVATTTQYQFNNQQQLKEEKTVDSRGNTIKKKIYYPINFLNETIFQQMNSEAINQISQPVQTESYYNDELMGQTKIDYSFNVNGYKPVKTYSSKGANPLEARLSLTYDNQDNVIQVDQLANLPNGQTGSQVLRSTAYIWGHAKEYLLAKVENATLSDINSIDHNSSILLSTNSTDIQINAELQKIRDGLSNALMTSYTYNPLIGVKNVVDSRDYKTNYLYDELNRLKHVTDAKDKMLEEYKYKYIADGFIDPEVGGDYDDLEGSILGDDSVSRNVSISLSTDILGGSGNFTYIWSLDGVEIVNANSSSIQRSFDTEGSYLFGCKITDVTTEFEISLNKSIDVLGALNAGLLTSDKNFILVGDTITFENTGAAGGTGDYSYEWFVNDVVQSNVTGAVFAYNGFATSGSYAIKLKFRDNNTLVTKTKNVSVYDPLAVTSIVSNVNEVIVNTLGLSFTASGISGGSNDKTYEWYVNGNKQSGEDNNSFFYNGFNTVGNYLIEFKVIDNVLPNHSVTISKTITAFPQVNSGILSANKEHILVGESVIFQNTGASGGSGNYVYVWYVNNVLQNGVDGSSFTYNAFNTAGNYEIKLEFSDPANNNVVETKTTNVDAYNPLTTPGINLTSVNIEIGENQYFNTSNVGGGSNNKTNSWYVKFGSGSYTQIPSQSNTYITYDGFTNAGIYTIKFRVADNNFTNYFKEVESVVNVYSTIQIANSDISVQSPVEVNSEIDLNINTASGGSGDFEYEWDIINQSVSPNNFYNVGTWDEIDRNRSNILIGYDLVGASVKVQCTVHDKLTGNTKTVFKIISVEDYQPITGLSVVATDTDADPETASYRLSANNVQGGSGNYTYRWVINGSIVQETASNIYQYINLSCSKQTETVTCVAIDDANSTSIPVVKLVRLDFDCSGQ